MDSNHRPHAYQACALTSWAISPSLKSFDFSGDEEIRTLDPLLARQVLSQLSYIPICSYSDLSGLFLFSMKVFKPMDLIEPFLFSAKAFKPMGLSGLEPPTSRLSGVRSNQLSYKPICHLWQWRWRDSNSRPPACKAGALPTELHPHNLAPTCSPTSSPMQYHRPLRS